MADRIDIEIADKISAGIAKKLTTIAENAKKAHTGIKRLKDEMNLEAAFNKAAAAENKLAISLKQLSAESSKAKIAQQKLIAEASRTAQTVSKTKVAFNQAAISEKKLTTVSKQLEAQTHKTKTAFYQKEVALNKAAEAEFKTEAASIALDGQLNKVKITEQRLNAELIKNTVIQQKLKSATAQTSITQSKAAAAVARVTAAENRAAQSTLRLSQAQTKARKTTKGLNTDLGMMLRTAVAYAGVGFGGAALIGLGDTYTRLQNKLKNVTESEEAVVDITERLFDIANKTRSPIEETTQAFQRFDLALQELGASQQESLRLTETVNKQLLLSGAATSEQKSALLQLSQAFNKGKLDGDEFRSVMELMPPVAKAIANELKVTRGELLNLAPQGKITAEVMRKALANVADEVDGKFGKLAPTIGQSFTVFKNKATEAFGLFDKKYGITKKMAELLLTLGDNTDLLAVALATLVSLLAVAFGPSLLANATKFFGLLAANPWGLAIVGLTTLVGLFAVFKDDISVTEDGFISLGDVMTGTFSYITDSVKPMTDFFKNSWNYAFGEVRDKNKTTVEYFDESWGKGISETKKKVGGFESFFGSVLFKVLEKTKNAVNFSIGMWKFGYGVIKALWTDFPTALGGIFKLAVNGVLGQVEFLINGITSGLNNVFGLLNKAFSLANKLYKKAGAKGPLTEIKIPEIQEIKLPKFEFADESRDIIKKEFDAAFNADHLGTAWEEIKKKSKFASDDRLKTKGAGGTLREKGPTAKSSSKSGKEAETYAQAIEKVNRQLNSQIKLTAYLGDEYKRVQMFERINNALLNKKFELTENDKKTVKDKINLLIKEKAIQSELNKIYKSTTGKVKEIDIRQQALRRAFDSSIISAREYSDALYDLNVSLYKLKINNEGFNEIYGETVGKYKSITESVKSLNIAYSEGLINIDNYRSRLSELRIELSEFRLDSDEGNLSDVLLTSFASVADGFDNVLTSMSESLGGFLQNMTDGFADSFGKAIVYGDNLGDSLENVAKGAMSQLISSIVKMGVQWVVSNAIQTASSVAALATTTTASVGAAAVMGQAWASPAALASLASFGGNAIPAAAGISAVAGISNSLAAAGAATKGFEQGGYTGNIPTGDVAGVVHGQEFVLNARAVSRIGQNKLQDLQTGRASVENTNSDRRETEQQEKPNGPVIMNLLDSSLFADWASTPEGQNAVLNIISNNPEFIKQF